MKNLICQCIYVPAFTPGREIWVMTETARAQIQGTEMSFLHNVARLCLRDRVRSSDIQKDIGVELLLGVERSQSSNWKETPGYTQNSLERLYISSGLQTPQDPPGGSGKCYWEERCLECPAQPLNGWILFSFL